MESSIPASCVNCGSSRLNFREEKWNYSLYECSDCAIQFWNPFQGPGNEHYETSGRYILRNADPRSKKLYDSQKWFLKSNPSPGKSLLDLGMGSGRFLAEARAHGYVVTGTDFDGNGVKAAKEIFGLTDVYNFDLSSFFNQFPERKFSIITMFDVLEHLDSYSFLNKANKALEPGGLFVVNVPNRECWKEWFRGEGPPLHLTRWNAESIEKFLRQYGFSARSIQKFPLSYPHVLSVFNARAAGFLSFSTVKRIESSLSSKGRVGEGSKTRTMRFVRILSKIKLYGLFGLPAAVLYAYLWATGEIYTELYVVAEKPLS
jgi:SAM-dependent methyltransferase